MIGIVNKDSNDNVRNMGNVGAVGSVDDHENVLDFGNKSVKGCENMEGLVVKYEVRKKKDGSLVDGCFVLRPDRDEAARRALLTYADVTTNHKLAADIRSWLKALEVR